DALAPLARSVVDVDVVGQGVAPLEFAQPVIGPVLRNREVPALRLFAAATCAGAPFTNLYQALWSRSDLPLLIPPTRGGRNVKERPRRIAPAGALLNVRNGGAYSAASPFSR